MKLIFKRFNLPVNQMKGNKDGQYIQWNNWDFVFENIYQPILSNSDNVFLHGSLFYNDDRYRLGLNNKYFDIDNPEVRMVSPPEWSTQDMQKKIFDEVFYFLKDNFSIGPYGLQANDKFFNLIDSDTFKNIISGSSWNRWNPILYCQMSQDKLHIIEKTLTTCTFASNDFRQSERKYVTWNEPAIKASRVGLKSNLITIQLFMNEYFIVLLYGDNISNEINKIGNLIDSASDEYKNKLGDLFLGKNI